MKTIQRATGAVLMLFATTFSNAGTREEALASLVAAERGFAQASLDSGYKASFLGVLAEDSTIYQPGPVNGRQTVSEGEEPAIILSWYPAVADVAASGDLGFTSGPYTVDPKDPAATWHSAGHYTSVWRRNASGKWELLVDLGTRHPPVEPPIAPWEPTSGETQLAAPLAADELEGRRAALLARDAALAKAADQGAFIPALEGFAEPEAWIYRPANAPFSGLAAAAADEKTGAEIVHGEPTSASVSAAGDWGYTLGSMTITSGEKTRDAHYLRLWRRSAGDGKWRLFLDTFALMPPPAPPSPPTPPAG